MLEKVEMLLNEYFSQGTPSENGIPSVRYFADRLYLSPNYLSDLLRNLTGQNTQQHLHNYIIELAKQKLSLTTLSISEIAYELGFEYSQSFSRLFRKKMKMTPLEFRVGVN